MKKMRVLFIGNSHTFYNDMPMIFKTLAQAAGDTEVEVTMQAHPGVHWSWHLRQGAELRFALVHGGYDYAVLQQAAHPVPALKAEDTLRDGKELIRLIRSQGIKPIVLMPWAEKKFPEHQAVMYDTYQRLSKEEGVPLSPAGYVFERVQKERPDIDLYWFDGEHCSPYGSYVVAASAYTVIFGKSPEGLPKKAFSFKGGAAENFAVIREKMDKLREEEMVKPENSGLQAEIDEEYRVKFPPIWDKAVLEVTLDAEKCALLQKWIWEAYLRLNRQSTF